MRKLLGAIVAASMVTLAMGSATATAATEFGVSCTGNRAEEGEAVSLIQLTQNGAPTAAPVSGVITQWKTQLVPVPVSVPQQLKVFRPTANPAQFQVVGESTTSNVVGGLNTFPTRIPVQAGDRLGLFGPSNIGTLFCEGPEAESPGNTVGGFAGSPAPGSTATLLGTKEEVLVPVVAAIEPDVDNDGFGDETQDKCPQSTAVQVPCPVITLSTSATAAKGLAKVLVTSSLQAQVSVAGTVNLGKGKKVKLGGGSQITAPGTIAKFTLLFPQRLKAKLKALGRKQFLWLRISTTAPNVVGPPTVSNTKVKLRGQAKPKPQKPRRQAKP